MKQSIRWVVLTMVTMLLGTACRDATESDSLAGAWRSQIRFSGGTLAEWKNLEFMYVFNAGGTMTESSNYDASPPGPPAYGAWRRTGPRQFEARYLFFATQPPGPSDELAKVGWLPAGHGVLTERIVLSDDGKSFKSAISYTGFDPAGKPVEGAGEGTGIGARIGF
jgi:hypothetical protein